MEPTPTASEFLTCRARDDALPPLLIVQMRHLIVGSAELEAENRKKVFPLEENAAFEPITEVDGMVQGSLVDDIVDA